LKDEELKNSDKFIGIDLNTTGHSVVIGDPKTGKVWKLGKKAQHIQNKYRDLRTYFQKKSKFRKFRQIKRRQSNIRRDLNHKISRFVVNLVNKLKKSIRLEDLTTIRKIAKTTKSFRYTLNSWPFYQFKMFLEYKAKKLGISVQSIDPRYTSQKCSRCGYIEKANRNDKNFC
jgi:putative transposase